MNTEFKYPAYFSILPPGGPQPEEAFAEGFFARPWRRTRSHRPGHGRRRRRVPAQCARGRARARQEARPEDVYDKSYPPATADYTPSCAPGATNPDLFLVCSCPPDTVGLVRASSEVGLKAKLYGGGMVGLQSTAIKIQLGPLLNGILVYDFWLPWSGLASDEGPSS